MQAAYSPSAASENCSRTAGSRTKLNIHLETDGQDPFCDPSVFLISHLLYPIDGSGKIFKGQRRLDSNYRACVRESTLSISEAFFISSKYYQHDQSFLVFIQYVLQKGRRTFQPLTHIRLIVSIRNVIAAPRFCRGCRFPTCSFPLS
jgi:hypothetical protein